MRWYRRRIVRHWTQPCRAPGWPPTAAELCQLALRLAAENPTWAYRRVQGELAGLGHTIAASTVWRILNDARIDPAPTRSEVTWSQFNAYMAHLDGPMVFCCPSDAEAVMQMLAQPPRPPETLTAD